MARIKFIYFLLLGFLLINCEKNQIQVDCSELKGEYCQQKERLIRSAYKYLKEGIYDSVEVASVNLEEIARPINDMGGIIYADFFRAYALYFQEDYFNAERLLNKHINEIALLPNDKFKAIITKVFGNILMERGKFVQSKRYLEESLLIKTEIGDSSFLYQLYLDLAFVDYKLNKDLNAATAFFDKGIKIAESYSQTGPKLYVLSNFAITIKREHPEEALKYMELAFELEEEVAPNLYFEKASIFKTLKRYNEALAILEICENLAEEQGFSLGVLKVNYLQAEIYYLQGRCDQGLQVINSSEPLMNSFPLEEIDFLLEMKKDLLTCLNRVNEVVALQNQLLELKDQEIESANNNSQEFIEDLVGQLKLEMDFEVVEANLAAKRKENVLKNIIIGVLTVLILVVSILGTRNRRLYRNLQNSFEKLVERYQLDLKQVNPNSLDKNSEDVKLFNQIKEYMESERPFLDSGFKTETLCTKFDISYTKLKELLNEHLNEQSFSNYVNSYRVNYAKVILADPEKNHYSIEGIALESGFGTRQSFYKVFEQQTGLKPNYFRENIQKKKLVS